MAERTTTPTVATSTDSTGACRASGTIRKACSDLVVAYEATAASQLLEEGPYLGRRGIGLEVADSTRDNQELTIARSHSIERDARRLVAINRSRRRCIVPMGVTARNGPTDGAQAARSTRVDTNRSV